MQTLIFAIITFVSCVLGSICGLGGGVIIKPCVDAFGNLPVIVTSFLCSCTVFAMSFSSVVMEKFKEGENIDVRVSMPLGVGSVFGGLSGNVFFEWLKGQFADENTVGAVQASVLIAIVLLTIIYTFKKSSFQAQKISNSILTAGIGVVLGIVSSFLGIGGGCLNVVVLQFFFSLSTKSAVQNSLLIILVSQGASIAKTLFSGVPDFEMTMLTAMIVSGILGAIIGRRIFIRLSSSAINVLFIILNLFTMIVCIFNVFKFGF